MRVDSSLRARSIELLSGTGQDHLITILEHGTQAEQSALLQQLHTELADVDFRHLNIVLRDSLGALDHANGLHQHVIEPPPKDAALDLIAERHAQPERVAELEAVGYDAIHNGHVAVLVLAGGSGTRLGAEVPKGLFMCGGMQEKKSLFQLHCEKVRRREEISAARHHGKPSVPIPLLVMTSTQNDAQTRNFFKENNYFGLSSAQVYFFRQVSLPCYDEASGRILMESSGRMCLSPGGNGGVYSAMAHIPHGEKESLMQRLERRGVKYVQIMNVDNLLAQVADPIFFGYAVHEGAHVVVKSSPKVNAEERVGVYAKINKEWGVVEYTEIGEKRASMRDPETGELMFNHANISCYLCTMDLFRTAAEYMKTFTHYHAARKTIKTMNGIVMGVKMEAFIFDLFRLSKDCAKHSSKGSGNEFRIILVDRDEEFAPIKNADGSSSDTPTDATRLAMVLHTKWLAAALRKLGNEKASAALEVLEKGELSVEVSPLVSSNGEGLEGYLDEIIRQILGEKSKKILIKRGKEGQLELSNM